MGHPHRRASPSCSTARRCRSTCRPTRPSGSHKATGVGADQLVTHASGDTVMVGEIPITLIHTPGHTPGSQCFLVDGRLVAGDTLFLDGCGRTDLPGGDPEQMYLSLTQRLAQVPDDAVLFPGHLYSEKPSATMAETRSRNVVFRPRRQEQWMMMFAAEPDIPRRHVTAPVDPSTPCPSPSTAAPFDLHVWLPAAGQRPRHRS